jgi:glycosyltransferase involved in cell wall biosynthesis
MASRAPLISCVMPTADRPQFVAQAVRYFRRQEHPALELIIVDDGRSRVTVDGDDRIRIIRLDRPHTVGHKRNLACDVSRGEFVAHWDDDDWHSPRRLRVQLAAMLEGCWDVVGISSVLHYSPKGGSVWLRDYAQPAGAGVAVGTLLYRKSTWQRHPFLDADIGEGAAFLEAVPAERLLAVDDTSLYVAVIHDGNAGRQNFHNVCWRQRTTNDVAELLIADWDFYTSMRHGTVAPAPPRPVWSDAVNLSAHFMVADGYGAMAEYIALGMDRAGAQVNLVPYGIVEAGLSDRLLELLRQSRLDNSAPLVHHCTVDAGLHLFARCREYILSTMWESDGLPTPWLSALHGARAVVVPTRWCADVFRAHGITRPIHVVPDGVDPAVYHYLPPSEREGVTTLVVCTNTARKHLSEGIAAWQRAFAGDPTARLLLKAHHQAGTISADDPRITFADVNEPTRGIAHWYRRADVLMALGNEGFGLPLIEAMACGLPVVALDAEGQHDLCTEIPDLVLRVPGTGREPHIAGGYGRCGMRTVPSVDAAADRLRWVAQHRSEARAMGREASAWVIAHRNVWDKGPAILEIVEQSIDPPRSLRPGPLALPTAS